MEAERLLAELRAGGAVLSVEDDRLRVRALRGAITAELRACLARRKADLMTLVADEREAGSPNGLEALQTDVGAQPQPPAVDLAVAATVRHALALTSDERQGWQREIVAMLRWAEAGRGSDADLAHDLAALRRIVPPGACLDCGGRCPDDGRQWCDGCRAEAPCHSAVAP